MALASRMLLSDTFRAWQLGAERFYQAENLPLDLTSYPLHAIYLPAWLLQLLVGIH